MLWSLGRFLGFSAITLAALALLILLFPPVWMAGAGERATAWRRRARSTALSSGLIAWALAPFWAVPKGTDKYRGVYAHVAAEAYEAAWMHNDNPIGRLAFPAVRVRRVWRDPGHCPPGEPGGREPYAEWRADVQYYTYFGIPGPGARMTCGGWAW